MKNAAEDTFFKKRKFINCNGVLLDFSTPKIMGIINLTPDSFYDGGKYTNEKGIITHAGQLLEQGAAIIDLGGQSTRPGATLMSAEDEWKRIEAPLKKIRKEFPTAVLSVDTFYGGVAEQAVEAGADLINDISGGTMDVKMVETIARLKVPYIVMHMQGTPQTMQQNPHYEDVLREVIYYFSERIQQLVLRGVNDIIIDPGFGFGKTLEHNYELLRNLESFRVFERPILVGLSRKSMVNKVLNIKAENALNGTSVLNTIALLNGANILRVHDVHEAVETIKLVNAFQHPESLI